eukprot:8293695-Ditylum_brightwellii.AAC.1
MLIQKFSDDIGTEFGLDKCAMLTIQKGKVVPTTLMEDIPLLDDREGYKYLEILQRSDFFTQKVKDTTIKEYYSCVWKICKAQLSEHITMTAICAFAVPVMQYTFGVLKWNKGDLANKDRKMRKILT